MDSPMNPVDTSTYLGEWDMPNLTYQQGINGLESLKPLPHYKRSRYVLSGHNLKAKYLLEQSRLPIASTL